MDRKRWKHFAAVLYSCATILIFITTSCEGKKLSTSFSAPLESFDETSGKRILPDWQTAGSTRLLSHAVQLTSSEPHQRGAIWSKKSEVNKAFTWTTTFRLSSREKEYGEALAFFVLQENKADKFFGVQGSFYGCPSMFQGLAVVLTPLSNVERWAAPGAAGGEQTGEKVTVWVNEGTPNPRPLGHCSAKFQYSEARDDFRHEMSSGLRITYSIGGMLDVKIDPRGDVQWRTCYTSLLEKELQGSWPSKAVFGIVAKTTDKTNNMQVMGCDIHDTVSVGYYGTGENQQARPMQIRRQLDESLYGINNKLEVVIASLQDKTDRDRGRIAVLEDKLTGDFVNKCDARLDAVERRLMSKAMQPLAAHGRRVEKEANIKVRSLAGVRTDEWVGPAAAILALLLLAFLYIRKQTRMLSKYSNSLMASGGRKLGVF